jgi:uncharacterized membrane protein (UPF0127 family)
MRIFNKTKGRLISAEAALYDGFLGRFRGLMLSPRRDIVLKCRRESVAESTIHMMFMLYALDVIWVSSDMRVADVKRDVPAFSLVKPVTWGMHSPQAKALYVVELGLGRAGDTAAGDEIAFSDACS